MDYTTNYHLPQWAEEDRILRTDFNQMCADIEESLNQAHTGITEAKTAAATAQTTAEQLPYVVGTYTATGDAGQTNQTIEVGFRPRFVIIFDLSATSSTSGEGLRRFTACGPNGGGNCYITETGFMVTYSASYPYPSVNKYGVYSYIAFR